MCFPWCNRPFSSFFTSKWLWAFEFRSSKSCWGMQDGISTGANTNFWPKLSTYSRPVAVPQCRWRLKSSTDGASQPKWFRRWTWLCPAFILPPACPLASPSWDLTATVPRRLCCLFLYSGLSMSWVCLTSPPPCTLYTLMSSSRDCHSTTFWMSSLSQPAWVSPPLPAQPCM